MYAYGAVRLFLGLILVYALTCVCSAIAVVTAFALPTGIDPDLRCVVAIHQKTPSSLIDMPNVGICSILEEFSVVTPAEKMH